MKTKLDIEQIENLFLFVIYLIFYGEITGLMLNNYTFYHVGVLVQHNKYIVLVFLHL